MTKLHQTEIQGQPYLYLSPQQAHQMCVKLAQKIQHDIDSGKIQKPDIILGVARGAFVFVKTIADWLNIDHIYFMRAQHYSHVGKRFQKPTILEAMLPTLQHQRVLIIDNLVETGKTMDMASNYLNLLGVDTIHTAVLFKKPQSHFDPDYHVANTKAWIIFYFDLVETVKMIGATWSSSGMSLDNIHHNFTKIGLPENEVNIAMKQIFNYSPTLAVE